MKIYYTDAEVATAELNEATLRLYFYNETDGTWFCYEFPRAEVNTDENYVWVLTNHFSVWGVFGDKVIVPVSPPSSNSPGGGSSLSCITDWVCTEWSECVDATQIRVCEKEKPSCSAGLKPFEVQPCGESSGDFEEMGFSQGNESKTESSGITGAVVGGLQTADSYLSILFVVCVFGATAFIIVRQRRMRTK